MSDTVAAEIDRQAPNRMVRLAMRLGALLEGGTLGAGPEGVGDQGHSWGPFQINLPFHPGVTEADAVNPSFAVHYMLPSYTSAAAQVPAGLWQSNPELAAETTARIAERPAADYFTARGRGTVDHAWSIASGGATGSLGGFAPLGGSGGAAVKTSSSDSSSSPCGSPGLNPTSWAPYFFCRLEQDAKPALFEATAVIAGAGLVVVGLVRAVSRTQTFKAAKSAAVDAAQIGAVA